jgi:hypothetical protein
MELIGAGLFAAYGPPLEPLVEAGVARLVVPLAPPGGSSSGDGVFRFFIFAPEYLRFLASLLWSTFAMD